MTYKEILAGLLGASAAAAAGCTTSLHTAHGEVLEMRSPEFRQYVERVFREQNEVATQLTFVLLDGADLDAESLARLDAADARLLSACAELNELAARRRDSRRTGPVRSARAARAAPACEAATLHARTLLRSLAG